MKLEQLHIADPCHADWNTMAGDDQTRFCESCQKQVHDLSARSRADGEALLAASEGRLCVQFQRNARGRVVTRDGWRRFAVVRRIMTAASFALTFVATLTGCRRDVTTTELTGRVTGSRTPVDVRLQGEVAVPCSQPTTSPTTVPATLPTLLGSPAIRFRGEVAAPATTQPVLSPLPVSPQEDSGEGRRGGN
ncbi:MAG: hypothetical protein QM754_08355 [Tepidisphaeraceae bacterium]